MAQKRRRADKKFKGRKKASLSLSLSASESLDPSKLVAAELLLDTPHATSCSPHWSTTSQLSNGITSDAELKEGESKVSICGGASCLNLDPFNRVTHHLGDILLTLRLR